MKQLLLSLLLLAGVAPAAPAQSTNPLVWCPPGATWTYGWRLFSEYGTITVRYARDTVVAGQPAQLLTRQLEVRDFQSPGAPPRNYRWPSLVTRTVGDRVDVQANGQFYTLYDFAALPGTSWLTPRVLPLGPCPSELVRVTVNNVGTQQFAGRSFRWFQVHLTTPAGATVPGQWAGFIYEQLGSLLYMQPQSPTCGTSDPGYMGSLGGFQAAGGPVIGYNTAGNLVLAAAPVPGHSGWVQCVYPNPSAGLVSLTVPAKLVPEASLQLLDLVGRVIQQRSVPANRLLDMRGLPIGAYTLLLLAPGQAPLMQRLLVE